MILGPASRIWGCGLAVAALLGRSFGRDGLRGTAVLDLGTGSGVAGLAAAALGASAVLTDRADSLAGARFNAERLASAGVPFFVYFLCMYYVAFVADELHLRKSL